MKLAGLLVDTTVTTIAQRTSYGGAATSFFGWLSSIDWLAAVGAAAAVLGFFTSLYFQIRRDRRETALNRARIAALKGKQ